MLHLLLQIIMVILIVKA